MVIAGIIFGYVSFSSLVTYVLFSSYYSFALYNVLLFMIVLTLLYTCFYLLRVNDIKSLIAYSTINQLSYLFYGLFSFQSVHSLYHVIVHAFFKSLLFLLAGSLIHVSANFQSFYRLKSYCYLLKSLFAVSLLLSLFNYSKELILSYSYVALAVSSHFHLFTLAIVVSVLYSLKLFVHIFALRAGGFQVLFSSFVLCCYGLTVLFADSLLHNVFSAASFSHNSFSLSYVWIVNQAAIPVGLYLFVYLFAFILGSLFSLHNLFHNAVSYASGFVLMLLLAAVCCASHWSNTFPALTCLLVLLLLAGRFLHGSWTAVTDKYSVPTRILSPHYLASILSISYFNYIALLIESLSATTSTTMFAYSFIPLSVLLFVLL
jgi:NADH:ubiquinone oxidoreductase subunit 5 (subunit L)/multisubunit Na+/H+ antiporter MnhA subunit